jgi:hypothetical protein
VDALRLTRNAIALIKACIEPLGAIGHTHLVEDRVHQFFVKDLGILATGKIAIALSPHSPAIGHTMRHLLGRGLTTQATIGLGHTGLSEIFLRQNIGGDLAPLFGHFHARHFKHDFSRRVTNDRRAVIVFELIEHIHVITSKAATKLQPALGGGWLLTGHNQKRIYWVWSYVQYRSGYRMVVNENIFYPKENKPSNIHIVWKIGNKSRTTLVCRGFGHFFT